MPAFLTDWTLWSFATAAIAIVLSQAPPVRNWFKRPKLAVEVHSRISLTHKIGNPNAQLHLIIENAGGRRVRIREMTLDFSRNNQHLFKLPVQNYLEQPNDTAAVMFTPFVLKPDEEWSHIANFLNLFSRQDERTYRQLESEIRSDIFRRRQQEAPGRTELTEADPEIVRPVLDFFQQHFGWLEGEYKMELTIKGDIVNCSKNFDFTIFESESEELRAVSDHYKYGSGIFWNRADVLTSLLFTIRERQGGG